MRKPIVGHAAIDRSIKSLRGVGQNLNERVQDIAVAIIAHAANPEAGNGDVSRALSLCQTVKSLRSLNVNYLVGFFLYFGNCRVNLKEATVKQVSKDSKAYRGFDPDGATHYKWYEAVDDNGVKAHWYAGPAPAEYVPGTMGDFAEAVTAAAERLDKAIEGTRETNGKVVPLYDLTAEDIRLAHQSMEALKRIAATLMRRGNIEEAQHIIATEKEAMKADKPVAALLKVA